MRNFVSLLGLLLFTIGFPTMHHWYPEGYIGYTRQTQIPVWKKSYHDLPLYQSPNPPATSRSTGEPLGSGTPQSTSTPSSLQSLPQNTQSALVFNTGAGPVSTSRLPFPQGAALAGNYQKVPNIVFTKVTSRGKAGHSSTVVPASPSEIGSAAKSLYNMNAAPTSHRVPRVDSIYGPSSVHTGASAKRMELAILEPPPWDGVSEFIDGSTYFKVNMSRTPFFFPRRLNRSFRLANVYIFVVGMLLKNSIPHGCLDEW